MARFTTERGLDRLVNFSDATVAIALTLLILPLSDLAGEAHRGGLGAVLSAHVGAVLAFLISFIVIAVMWMAHHRFFELLVDYSPALIRLNLVWLFAVVVLPFSTEGLNVTSSHADRVSVGVYIGNLFLGFTALAVMRAVVMSRPGLVDPEQRGSLRLASDIALCFVCAAALIVGLIAPHYGLYVLLLIPFARSASLALPRGRRTR